MRFRVVIGEQVYAIEVPEELLRESAEFHARLDRDMDSGKMQNTKLLYA
ncbi:MAG: hypothetical protein WD886_10090 [Burkholderiales bacterium]